jgi:hypothetical protein
MVLAGVDAVHGLGIGLDFPPPSGHQLRLACWLPVWFTDRLGAPAPLQFGYGFPGCVPGGVGVGGPLLVAGVAGFEALTFGGQLGGEGCGVDRAEVIAPGLSGSGLL